VPAGRQGLEKLHTFLNLAARDGLIFTFNLVCQVRIILTVLILTVVAAAAAGETVLDAEGGPGTKSAVDPLTHEIMPGELLFPDESPVNTGVDRKCMTVCARWGEDCMLINRGTGGMERRCRRMCKQFAEECF
jgi:hypothetical protein